VGSIVLHSPAGDDACCLHLFCPALKELRVLDVAERGDTVRIAARTWAAEASCPKCGVSSARVHSRYTLAGYTDTDDKLTGGLSLSENT